MKKIVFLASGNGTNLHAVLKKIKNKEIENCFVSLVISSKENSNSLKIAANFKIKSLTINSALLSDLEFNSKIFSALKQENPNLIVLAGFNQILSSEIVNFFKNKIINIHPSLIPAFSGKGFFGIKPHEAAIKRGVKISGATVHFVNNKPDEGPIILQKSVEVLKTDSPQSLQQRILKEAEWVILPKAINLFCSNRIEICEDGSVSIKERN